MIKSHILGYPRIGKQRELKFALEKFWKNEIDATQLQDTAAQLRHEHWQTQIDSGLNFITVGDFSYYDHVADHIQLLGCEPQRFVFKTQQTALERYFTMVRGQSRDMEEQGNFALEMTKWFDTNYHYMVPEFNADTHFSAHTNSLLEQVKQAQSLGHPIKVALIGPVTFLNLGKSKQTGFDPNQLLESLLPVYCQILDKIHQAGVEWVQLDEPSLGLDLSPEQSNLFNTAYQRLRSSKIKILLATYFSSLNGQTSLVCKLPVDGLHIDCVRANEDFNQVLDWLPNYKVLSLGLIDGRNIWKTDLDLALQQINKALESGKNEVWISASNSLLHVPYTLANDPDVQAEVRPWLSGAQEKLLEIKLLKDVAQASQTGQHAPSTTIATWGLHQQSLKTKSESALVYNSALQAKQANASPSAFQRQSSFEVRQKLQRARFNLPLYPTTTIGSFPQTAAIRTLRKKYKNNELETKQYWQQIQEILKETIAFQEKLDLDVLVHGEAERNDMVEYFGEQLEGFAFSANGWVQSYGSRCVKPPILFGDVSRRQPMTVDVTTYAQTLTHKPVKGMLTGPVTILQWSFVRNDQPRETTAKQIAYAIRDEVLDLEQAGIGMIQIDEPAYREGLPLRKNQWKHYLKWASEAFRITAGGVRDDTQIHTHMCYSEFNDILPDIAAMDADVITIETSRSDMELLRGFGEFKYPNEIGPGVYDIHSPCIPDAQQIVRLLRKASEVIPMENLWVNPDCGLKTRAWNETEQALKHMVKAAKQLRKEFAQAKSVA